MCIVEDGCKNSNNNAHFSEKEGKTLPTFRLELSTFTYFLKKLVFHIWKSQLDVIKKVKQLKNPQQSVPESSSLQSAKQ